MAKKAALAQFHRESISAAADRLFLENGVEKTTMDDIAKEADYSKATLYVYFQSKEEIYQYILLKAMQLLHMQFQACLARETEVLEQYHAICGVLAEFCGQYPMYFQSILDAIAADSTAQVGDMPESISQVAEAINGDMQTLIQNGMDQGIFRENLLSLPMSLVLWSNLSGVVSLALKKREYLRQKADLSHGDFLQFAFHATLRSILK